MIVNFTGFLLALIIVMHIWMIFIIYRMSVGSMLSPLYVYLNFLMILVEISTLLFMTYKLIPYSDTIIKVHFIAEVFVPPILVYLTQTYISGSKIPRFTPINISFFAISLVLSGLALVDFFMEGIILHQNIIFPEYTVFYWCVVIYFYFTFIFILIEFLKKYQTEKREIDLNNIKFILAFVIPISLLSFTVLKLMILWEVLHPLLYINYPVLSLLIFSIALKLQMVDFDEYTARTFSFFLLTGLLLFPFSYLVPTVDKMLYLLAVPFFLGLLFIYHITLKLILNRIQKNTPDSEYDLEDELETLLSETEKYIDNQALAQFIGELSLKVLKCTKSAVILSRFDIKPYQTIYLNGFDREELDTLMGTANSPFIETLEFNRSIINKFELSQNSGLYQTMDKYNIYLVIPMTMQSALLGFILLGGERKYFRITRKDLKFARFLSIKASYAFHNIQEIQKMVQSQKMAGLGTMASQLAHDFQSFITLVKLQSKDNEPLQQHASHMEKLVKDLLHYSRPKELHLTPVNIHELIEMSLDMIEIPPSIQIEKHYSDSVPRINVDIDQMRRVFVNLFENSINAMKNKSGRIKISIKPLRPLSNFRRNTWLYIEILDEGEGIPEEFLEKIFEPFFTTRKNVGGSGMGLAITRQIISSHKGFIDVTSKQNKGTIFNIRLPYVR
ncbi:MAG: hypothetical protein EH225_06715 [Calditrichaeota bacterium]|nr:hypothetical protein [Calditrichota bacterium]RQW03859.1 MAG: hypothetical protein EH225_06715 [Calditrichota bacterium]